MSLSQEVIEKLSKPLDPKRIKHRQGGGGMQLSYIKGHDAIEAANDIFGFGNWGYDLLGVEMQTVSGDDGTVIGGYYAARVKLTVTGCVPITEEGVCPIQESRNPRARIDAHDMARKGAITDALKRALRCYGDQFGNSLYDNEALQTQNNGNRQNNNRPANQGQNQSQGNQQPNRPVAAPAPTSVPVLRAVPNPPTAANSNQNFTEENATEQQINAIKKMAQRREVSRESLEARLVELYGVGLVDLSKNDASHFIQVFQSQAS